MKYDPIGLSRFIILVCVFCTGYAFTLYCCYRRGERFSRKKAEPETDDHNLLLSPCPRCGRKVNLWHLHGCKYIVCDCGIQSSRYHEHYPDKVIVAKWNNRPLASTEKKMMELVNLVCAYTNTYTEIPREQCAEIRKLAISIMKGKYHENH